VGIAGAAVLVQAARIQMVEGEHWRSLADSTTLAYVPIDAERGNILSSDGSLLATSLPFFEVRFDINTDALTDDIFNASRKDLAKRMSAFFGDKSTTD
jgi:cell division protein FtsI (penicillin-binding protein 3)